MRVSRITADLRVTDLDGGQGFYTDYLGLSTEEFNLGWVARYTSPDDRRTSNSSRTTRPPGRTPVISVLTEDVDGAYDEARRLDYEIVHPLTTEAWGVRRFFVRAPDGTVINVVGHPD